MNNRKDFFYGAGFDEVNQNDQSVNNGFNSQDMQSPNMQNQFSQSQDNMFSSAQQFSNSNEVLSNQGIPVSQFQSNMPSSEQEFPNSNNQFVNAQPVNNLINNQNKIVNNENKNGFLKVLLMLFFLIGVILLLFVFGHKTLSCEQEVELYTSSVKMKYDIEYWFGKGTSKNMIMEVDLVNLNESSKDLIIDEVKELADSLDEDNTSVKIDESEESIVLIVKKKISFDDEVESYDKEKNNLLDNEYICK